MIFGSLYRGCIDGLSIDKEIAEGVEVKASAPSRYSEPEQIPEGYQQVCSKCRILLNAQSFGRRKGQNRYWLSTVCKSCFARQKKIQRADQPDRYKRWYRASERRNQVGRLDRALRLSYVMTLDEYVEILSIQDHVCAVCRNLNQLSDGRIRRFEVDHDHSCCSGAKSCGQCVRGLLCARCNSLLGKAQDDLHLLMSLVEYLRRRVTRFKEKVDDND